EGEALGRVGGDAIGRGEGQGIGVAGARLGCARQRRGAVVVVGQGHARGQGSRLGNAGGWVAGRGDGERASLADGEGGGVGAGDRRGLVDGQGEALGGVRQGAVGGRDGERISAVVARCRVAGERGCAVVVVGEGH